MNNFLSHERDDFNIESLIDEKNYKFNSRYSNYKPVAPGVFGTVISAIDLVYNRPVAIKVITRLQDRVLCQRTLREIKILKHLKHKNIVSLVDLIPPIKFDNFQIIYLVQDFMEADLGSALKGMKLNPDHICFFIYQLLAGLKYIHSANVLHRDLKPNNLLINSHCHLKICDFGLARVFDPGKEYKGSLTEYVATRWYRAPEIMLNSRTYSRSVDLWSVGCVMAEMITNRPLFPGKDYLEQLVLIFDLIGTPSLDELDYVRHETARNYVINLEKCESVDFASYFDLVDPHAVEMLTKLLTFNPNHRITAEDALKLPYVSIYHDENSEPVAERQFDFEIDLDYISISDLKQMLYEETLNFR